MKAIIKLLEIEIIVDIKSVKCLYPDNVGFFLLFTSKTGREIRVGYEKLITLSDLNVVLHLLSEKEYENKDEEVLLFPDIVILQKGK